MSETKKVRLKEDRGNPAGGPVIRAGACIEIASSWADKWIAEGAAVEITKPSAEGKTNGRRSKKSKS